MLVHKHASLTSFIGFNNGSQRVHHSSVTAGFKTASFVSGQSSMAWKSSVATHQATFMSTTTVEVTRIRMIFGGFIGIGGSIGPAFERTAVSDNPDALGIKSFTGGRFDDKSVLIDQIATTQQNTGSMLNVNANPGTQKDGLYRFEIEIGGERHELSFTADHKETNKSFQQKMADAINNANIGVTASVATDESGKNSALSIEGNETGTGFTIRDIEGNAVALMGVGEVTQEAGYAIFSVNGGEKQTSASNDVDLGGGVTATLLQASDEAVNVTFKKDTKAMQDGVFSMINSINRIIFAAGENQGDMHTRVFAMSLRKTIITSVTVFKRVGISVGKDGHLTADPDKVKEAAENGEIEKFFSGDRPTGRNFLERLEQLFGRFNRNPWQFVNPAFKRMHMLSLTSSAVFSGFSQFNNMLDVKS